MVNLPWRRKPPPGWQPGDPMPDEMVEPLVLPAPPNPDFYDPAWDEWAEPSKKWNRAIGVVLVVALVLFVIGFVFRHEIRSTFSHSKASHVTVTTRPAVLKPVPFTIATGVGQAPSQTFTGSVGSTTPSFSIQGGLTVMTFSCNCTGAFAVTVIDANGAVAALPVNYPAAANYQGSVAVQLTAGTYTLKVLGTGSWKIIMSQPDNPPVLGFPFRATPGFMSLLGPFPPNRPMTITLATFFPTVVASTATVIYPDGSSGPALLSMTKAGEVSAPVATQDQPYYIQVKSVLGFWVLTAN